MKNTAVLLALLMSMSAAYAHPDHADTPPVVYKVDQVSKKNGALFYVTLEGAKVATANATGKLLLTKGTKKSEIALKPAGDNAMETAKPTKLVAGTQARAMITLPDNTMATTDFVVK